MKKIIAIVMTLCIVFGISSVGVWATTDTTWQAETSMPTAKVYTQSVAVGYKIYTFGGRTDFGSQDSTGLDIYNTHTNTWSPGVSMPESRRNFVVSAVGDKIYLIGGESNTLDIYDTKTDSWSTGAAMSIQRSNPASATVGNKIYVFGGSNPAPVAVVSIYDTESNTWIQGTNMITPRYISTASTVGDKIYVIGGEEVINGSSTHSNKVEIYDTTTSTWTSGAPLPTATWGLSSGVVGNNIYTFGGGYPRTSSVNVYNTTANAWSTAPALTSIKSYSSGAVVNGAVYAIGGYNGTAITNTVESLQVVEPVSVPDSPQSLTATVGDSVIDLSWSPVSNVTSYTVMRSTTAGGPYTTIAEGITSTAYSDTSLTNGTTYYYVVTADNIAGSSANSNEASATTQAASTTPDAPQSLTAAGGNSLVNLSWGSVSNATSYKVKRAATAGGPYTEIANDITTTSYSDTSVTNGTTYYYVVTAVNSAGESSNSNEASATPQAPAFAGKALLVITMTNGLEKEYDLSMTEVNAFINWYDGRTSGSGAGYYTFNKTFNLGPFLTRVDYITYDKIQNFEVLQYQ